MLISFIKQFRDLGAENCFSNGMCYWFAYILQARFSGDIVYDEVENHFGCDIDGVIYDITGNVSSKYNWIPWAAYPKRDRLLYERILRDCIRKEN